MIEYLERLEAEVLKAARAEEARAARRLSLPRPRVRLGSVAPVAAVCAAIAAAVVFLPREAEIEPLPARPGPVPATLTGSYSRGPDALIIDPDRYTIDTPTQEFVGDVRAQQDVLSFASGSTGPCAGRAPGRYLYRRDGSTLELRLIQDPCSERETALTNGSWRRDGS